MKTFESSKSTVGRFIWYSRDIQVGHIEPFVSKFYKGEIAFVPNGSQFSQNTIFGLNKPGRFRTHSTLVLGPIMFPGYITCVVYLFRVLVSVLFLFFSLSCRLSWPFFVLHCAFLSEPSVPPNEIIVVAALIPNSSTAARISRSLVSLTLFSATTFVRSMNSLSV